MTLYYIETVFGCGIRKAKNIQQARKNLKEEVGTYGQPTVCRKATKQDIKWVEAFGGYIPKEE